MRVVLSDLDDTLFDHRRATRAALVEACAGESAFARWSLDELDRRHREQLDLLHVEVLAGQRSVDEARVERFFRILTAASAERAFERAESIAAAYRLAYEKVWHPVPGATGFLAAVRRAGLRLVIITNNNVAEQRLKLDRCALAEYVDLLVTSEEVGLAKPHAGIFRAALDRIGATAADAVMVGDSWTADIEGARAAGIRAIWLNRFGDVSPDSSVPEIRAFEPLEQVLRTITGSNPENP